MRRRTIVVSTVAVAVAIAIVVAITASSPHARDSGEAAVRPASRPHVRSDGWWEWSFTGGAFEVSPWAPHTKPTTKQRAAEEKLLADTRNDMQPIRTRRDATRAGYTLSGTVDGVSDDEHLMNPSFIGDGHELDPAHPEALVIDTKTGLVVAAMFMADFGTHGPPVAPDATWHYHYYQQVVCFAPDGATMRRVKTLATPPPCEDGRKPTHTSIEMLHVWLIENPSGPFSTEMQAGTSNLDRIA